MTYADRIAVDPSSGCWVWTGTRHSAGYGKFDGRRLAHRVIYELEVGPIPSGMQIDHLCRNRLCVNPEHMEVVTQRENILRGTSPSARAARKSACPLGHPYDETNTYVVPRTGARHCRACHDERQRRRRSA